jgi:hypothetical protein
VPLRASPSPEVPWKPGSLKSLEKIKVVKTGNSRKRDVPGSFGTRNKHALLKVVPDRQLEVMGQKSTE